MSTATAGRNPIAVSPVEALIRTPSPPSNIPFHFTKHVCKAPNVGEFIFQEATSKWEDTGDRSSDSGKR